MRIAPLAWARVVSARKRVGAGSMAAASPYLVNGVYFVDYKGRLRRVGSGGLPATLANGIPSNRSVKAFAALRRKAKTFAASLVPPTLLTVRGEKKVKENLLGDCCLVTHEGNNVVFCVDRSHVLRVYKYPAHLEAEARIRPLLEGHLGLAHSEVRQSEGVIIEKLAGGVPFSHLDASARKSVFRELIRRYAGLARASLIPEASGADTAITDALISLAFEHWHVPATLLPEWLSGSNPHEWQRIVEFPRMPSHGDLYARNLMVDESGQLEMIDFERCGVLPFPYDILNLVLVEAEEGRYDLLQGLVGGDYDSDLSQLWQAANVKLTADSLWAAIAAAMVVHLKLWGRPRNVDWTRL